MYDWKLSALVVIGLMSIAGVVSNAAMAATNDGKGVVEVAWNVSSVSKNHGIISVSNVDDPLNAGSTHNILQFTYTAWENNGAVKAINMAGGRVRITFPTGWKVSQKYIRVIDGDGSDDLGPNNDGVVYQTDDEGKLDTDIFDTDDKQAEANAAVTFEADEHITINLGSEWRAGRSDIERELLIVLADVTAPIPSRLTENDETTDYFADDFANIRFQCSSSTKNGTLIRLSDPVEVKVGNILGDRDLSITPPAAETRDPLIREFKITPARVFPEDTNIFFEIVFEAPGPMYGSYLEIYVPKSLQGTHFTDADIESGMLRILGRGGATIDASTISGNYLTIYINTIDKGQKVIVSYEIERIGEDSGEIAAWTQVGSTYTGVKVTGGVVSARAGSGRMDISPISVEAGSRRRDITLTYTAYTKLSNVDIEIEPKGIVIDSNHTLQKNNSGNYGYISGSLSSADLEIRYGDDAFNATIAWQNITLEKNKTLRTTIRRVNISETSNNYDWIVRVDGSDLMDDPTTDRVNEAPTLSVVKTSGDAVRFEIIGEDIFPAASQQTLIFRFTAESTPIRNGSVSLTIPSALGTAPTTRKDTAGRVIATIDRDDVLEANQPTVSGRTVNVAIKRLEVGEAITITYGGSDSDTEREKAVLHYMAGDVPVSGNFRTSSNTSTRSAGTVTVKLTNVADGSGSATLSPPSVEAGSNNRVIEVVFTATGTMDGGKVSLEIPVGWGAMQEDPIKHNYVTTRGSAVSSLEVLSNRAIATLGTLAKGGSFRFIYGGGTAGTNNGVEVQDDVGIAAFTITSDGDGDGVFAPITSTLEHKDKEKIRNPKKTGKIYADAPGILQIEVIGASGGTGTATIDVTEVRAAADDVKLVFTYTPAQTIVDGELRFTVPVSWSKPQVEEPGRAGYTEVEGVGLGTATDNNRFSVTVPIFFLDRAHTITIIYGATETGRAVASTTAGDYSFKIEIKGGEGGTLKPIQPSTVMVKGQASGKGKAVIAVSPVNSDEALYAGDMGRKLTVTYTAAGQIVAGRIRLTIPFGWSAPTADTVTVRPSIPAHYDGQTVFAEGVNLNANGTVTFVYTGDVQPTIGTDVKFAVAIHGGRPEDSYVDVSGDDVRLMVDVGEARPGSGSGKVTPKIVAVGATGVDLTFTYTVVGQIFAPKDFRVQVPASWTSPSAAAPSPNNKGTYTVVHLHDGIETTVSVEKLDPVGRAMVARVKFGGLEVEAGDRIIFTYQNADAPATPEVSRFRMLFDGVQIQDITQVKVQGTVTTDDIIVTAKINKEIAKVGDAVTVIATSILGQSATFSVGSIVPNVAMTEFPAGTYTGRFIVVDDLHDGVHAVTVNLNDTRTVVGRLTIDTTAPTVTVEASPATAANGDTVTITARVSEAVSSVAADVSALDTTQRAPIPLTLSNGTYSGAFTIGDDNEAGSGMQIITVTAMDAASNSGMGTATVMLTNKLEYTSMIPSGVNLFHVPLDVEGLDTVGDLREMLGDAVTLMITYDSASGSWNSRSDDVMIAADLGIIVAMIAEKTVTFRGDAWGDGTSAISLHRGTNLIGLPLNNPDVTNVSDIMTLFGKSIVASIIVSTDSGQFHAVSRAGDPGDGPIVGDAAYLVTVTANRTATLMGTGWHNGSVTGAAPIPLVGYKVDNQTPVLSVEGAVVDEITGVAKEGFRVKVKNLSTKTALSSITSVEAAAGGYKITFVDLTLGHAARVGDVLEISGDSSDPLIGVKPVRHIVTVNDVKDSQIQLEDLIAYEIPAETDLLRNYPNPFNPETWIPYRLAEDADVTLTIYDANGELVRSINVGHQAAAVYESRAKAIYWDGRNRFGEQVASGIYFYSLSAGDFSVTRKMVILK